MKLHWKFRKCTLWYLQRIWSNIIMVRKYGILWQEHWGFRGWKTAFSCWMDLIHYHPVKIKSYFFRVLQDGPGWPRMQGRIVLCGRIDLGHLAPCCLPTGQPDTGGILNMSPNTLPSSSATIFHPTGKFSTLNFHIFLIKCPSKVIGLVPGGAFVWGDNLASNSSNERLLHFHIFSELQEFVGKYFRKEQHKG